MQLCKTAGVQWLGPREAMEALIISGMNKAVNAFRGMAGIMHQAFLKIWMLLNMKMVRITMAKALANLLLL
jgi:hypothetical protein